MAALAAFGAGAGAGQAGCLAPPHLALAFGAGAGADGPCSVVDSVVAASIWVRLMALTDPMSTATANFMMKREVWGLKY